MIQISLSKSVSYGQRGGKGIEKVRRILSTSVPGCKEANKPGGQPPDKNVSRECFGVENETKEI